MEVRLRKSYLVFCAHIVCWAVGEEQEKEVPLLCAAEGEVSYQVAAVGTSWMKPELLCRYCLEFAQRDS